MEGKRGAYFLVVVFALLLRSISGGCEDDAIGLANGYIVDNQISASSELNVSTPAKNGRLNYTSGSSWCASTSDSNPYLQIDLQTLHIICAVSTQGNSQGDQWVETYTLQSSKDGTTWTDYIQDGQIKVFLGNFNSRITAKRILFPAITAKYLRVIPRIKHDSVCMRVELYGILRRAGNIALFKPTSQSSTLSPFNSSYAVDGGKTTHISKCTHTVSSANPWWRVDLERVEPVGEVNILNRGDCCGDRLDGAEIRVGNLTANGGANNHLCEDNIQIPRGNSRYFICKPKTYGRYVYIRIPDDGKILSLCEVEVYSQSNLALNQPASQVSTANGGLASRAVDGNPNYHWSGDSCTHTDYATTDPWWRVDLGSPLPVAQVVIANRDCCSPMNSFEIRIGDSTQNGGVTNPMCGGTRSMSTGETKTFYCVPRRVGRYVFIRVLVNQKAISICEVQVYSSRRAIKACNNNPIGLADSSKVPDNRFTASSSGNNKVPSSGRLNGGIAWLPATTNKDDFLQIDLGSIFSICSVATQGAPNANEWTKTYKIMTSLDNSNWTTYAENNVDKIFSGNNDHSSIIRNDLYDSPLAKFIRLYPLAYHSHKALRVEVYGSSEGCQSSLGIKDSQLSASSKSDSNHAAIHSRLYSSSSWCSASASTSEYLQVDLGQTKTLTGVATQGDPTNDKWVTRYKVQFGDSNTRWFRQLSFQGNERRDQIYVNWFSEPIETRSVRIVPLAWKNSVCLRFDLYGCDVLLKVPKPTINVIQDTRLQGSKGSFVELKCNSSSRSDLMTAAIRWGNEGRDITNLASGALTRGKFVLSTLRVNFTTAKDILSTYNCTRQSEASRIVNCEKIFSCLAFYLSLAGRLEPVYQSAVVTVQLRVPAAVSKITVDTVLGQSAIVRWQRLPVGSADEGPVVAYEIKFAKESNPNTAKYFNVTANDTSRVLEGLEQNTRYEVKVRGYSAVGSGLWSSTAYFKTARNVYCEEKILGLDTGLYPDMSVSSSQFNTNTSASHSSMSYAADLPWCANLSDLSPYLETDLVDVHVICALSTRGNPRGEHWVETYTLQSSLDGTTWTDYKEGDQQRIFLGNFDSTSTVKEELYSGIAARKVRLHVKTFHGLACLKLQLFGVKQTLENLALNQPASQLSIDNNGVASRAVDGTSNIDWNGGSCTHTNPASSDPWWRVDLGSPLPVAEVVIVSRDCCSILNGFKIRIGNSTTAANVSNQDCGSSLQVGKGQRKSFRCVSTIFGRYVYVILPGDKIVLTLCEVEVYSTISNLARGQSSIQSSTDPPGSSSRAVDGGTSKVYSQNSCTHTKRESNPWWRVDLGSSRPVGQLVIVNRADCSGSCGDRLKEFEIWIGDVDEQNGGTSNRRCGILHGLNRGDTKSIFCVPRIVGRYVYIRIPGDGKILTLCEVEVYSRRSSNTVCATQPVGISDSFKIPNDRLSASTSRVGNEAFKGRLQGSSAWAPSNDTDSNDYLEIDLGSAYFICGVATQGNPSADEWTTEYKIKTSLSNDNWIPYMEHGREKIFPGNNDRTTLRRNGLNTSPLAKFIRFYPVSSNISKALRVEVYGYAQGSKTPLGLENGDILDTQLKASSNTPGAINGRLYNVSSWCSSTASSLEYLQIDLGNVKTIAGVATQGHPSSDKWVKTYALSYSYGGDRWTQYEGRSHQQRIFDGNNDRNSVRANWMTRPFVARYLRIYGQTWNSGICLRVDGYGSSLVNAPIIRPVLQNKIMQKTPERSVVMTCVVYGIPHVSVTWKTRNEELTNSSDITSTSTLDRIWEETVSNLTLTYSDAVHAKRLFQCKRSPQQTRILQCRRLDVTCNAKYFGTLLEFESTAFVSLADDLYLPEPPLQITITNISSSSVSLTWNSSDAGDAPILFYRVQYNTSLNLIPEVMNKTTTIRSIYISMLQPYTDYTFNVQGVSAIGDGPVSKPTSLKTHLKATLFISPPYVHKLHLDQRNVSLVCFGQGFPMPTIAWKKDGNTTEYPIVKTTVSAINSSKSLVIGAKGVAYQEAGNYTCEVYNGVDKMSKVTASVEVIFIPEFTITPQSQTVMEGVSVIFNCSATGIPTPKISWSYKDTAGLPPNSSQLSNGSLLISGVQNTVEYEATYICNASNRAGLNLTEASLTVWVHPRITKTSRRNITILLGHQLNMTCVVHGDPLPVVVWSKYGFQSILGAAYEGGNSSLIIHRVSIADEGIYACLGRSDAGSVSINFTVVVLEPAKISVTGPHVLKLLRDEKNITVKCFGRGKPSPTITWKKNGIEISKNASEIQSGVVQVVGDSSDAWNVSSMLYLRVTGVTYNDAGNYTCEVYNGVDSNEAVDSTIRVLFKPEFVEEPRHVAIVLQGNNVTLPCNVTGVPEPSIMWLFSGAMLPPSHQEEDGSLTIYSVRNNQSYQGLYTCNATSIAGILISNVTLIVDVPPRITPLQGASLTIYSEMNLTCVVEGDPFPIVYWTKNGQRIVTQSQLSPDNRTLTLNSKDLSTEGSYTCVASNRAGNSSSSAFVEVLVPLQMSIAPSRFLAIRRKQENTTAYCHGYGKPSPIVTWLRHGVKVPLLGDFKFSNKTNRVFQVVTSGGNASSKWNASSRLYIAPLGASYQEAGAYVCQVQNSVQPSITINETVQVAFIPEVAVTPKSQFVLEHDNATLQCFVSGIPQPNVTWFRGSTVLQTSGDVTDRSIANVSLSLNLINVTNSFEGNYTCGVFNVAGKERDSAELIVDVPPRFISPLRNTSILVNTTLNLTCGVEADPDVSTRWLKDDSENITGAMLSPENSTLTINHVQLSAEGRYKCVVWNRAGNATSEAYIEITVSPQVSLSQEILKLQRNETNVSVDCHGYGKPRPAVTWRKGQESISVVSAVTANETSQVVQTLMNTSGTPWNVISRLYLRLGGVTYEEVGNYTCEVRNGIGSDGSANATAEVLFRPEIVQEPTDEIVSEDSNVTFVCKWTGVPAPSIIWTFYSGLLPPSSGAESESLTVYTVKNTASYEGNYTCTAVNRAGIENTTVHLTVDVPATVLSLPQNVTVVAGSNLNLSCLVNGDPSPSVYWTRNGSRVINRVVLSNGNKTLIIRGVAVEDEGAFWCVTVNRAGNDSSRVYVEVKARSHVSISPTKELNLLKYQKNVTVDCHGYGKPTPRVTWTRNGKDIPTENNFTDYRQKIVQGRPESSTASPWNVTGRLYLRVDGVTYEDAGNYHCEVFNGVGGNLSATDTLQVFFIPEMVLEPKNTITVENSNATFSCNASGVPGPVLTWSFSRGPLPQSIVTKYSLTLLSVNNTELFEGSYTCNATNRAGYDTRTASLTVDAPARVRPLQNASPIINSDLNLTCVVEGDPVPTVYWLKNGTHGIPRAHVSADNRTLVIHDVDTSADGVYTCVAMNRAGNDSSSAIVDVSIPPEVLLNRELLKLRQNAKNVTVDCFGYGKPLPSVTWRKDGGIISQVSKVTVNDSDVVVQRVFNTTGNPWNVTNRLYVRVDGVTYQEAGNYTCEVSNGVGGQGSVNTTTEILFVPEFVKEPTDQIAKQGSNVTFVCNSSGVPDPVVSWTFNGGQLPSLSVTTDNGTLSLFLINNTAEYEGNYTCTTVNRAGINNSTAKLTVDVPARITGPPQNVSLVVGTNLSLTCSVFGDPSPSVYWIRNESRDISHAELSNGNTSLVIRNVTIDDEALYMCVTENRAGNDSYTASVEVKVHSSIFIPPPRQLNLLKYQLNVTADCYGYGKPAPTVKWTRNNKDIPTVDSFTHINQGKVVQMNVEPVTKSLWNSGSRLYLRVDGVTYQDAGNYTCEVFNGVGGNISTTDMLQVLFIPEFVVEPESKNAVEDSNATFNCNASGIPVPVITWSFDKGRLPEHVATNNDLTLISVKNTADFEGMYTCNASNRAGTDVKTANLTVDVPPTIRPLQSVSPIIHSDVNLTCIVEGDPVPAVHWLKNGSHSIPRANLTADNRTLLINNVEIATDGVYTCVGVNRAGNYSTSATVEILVPPQVLQSQTILTLRKNETNVTIDCYGYGKPLPLVTWIKGAGDIPRVSAVTGNSSDHVVQMSFNTSGEPWNVTSRLYLRTDGVTYQEAGKYTCRVSNGVGDEGIVNATTEVLFLPEFSREPADQIIPEDSNVTFICISTGVPTPSINWTFDNGSLPPLSQAKGSTLVVPRVKNNPIYQGIYTCTAVNRAGVSKTTAQLTVDVLPFVYQPLQNATLITGRRLNLTCLVGGDPRPSIHWTKNGESNIPRAQFLLRNFTLVIDSVEISDEGLYECKAESRAGNITTSAYIEVHAPSRLYISPSKELKLIKLDENITVDCHGYGKPKPYIQWMRNGTNVSRVEKVTAGYRTQVVQALLDQSEEFPWNVTSRLYLRVAGVTYQDAGNYTCEVFNGVEGNYSLRDTLQVFFRPEFTSKPKDKIVLEGKNVTFPCNATGVPKPNISWWFNNENLSSVHAQLTGGSDLTVYMVKNNGEFEGNYTCKAINRAGFDEETAQLIVDVVPSILTPLKNVTLLRGQMLNMTCSASGDPLPTVQWTKDGNSTIPNAQFSQNNSRLVIVSVQIRDEGRYECNASSRAGADNSKATVAVQVMPKVFVGRNKTLILQKGQKNVIINCRGNGYPKPEVLWKKQTKEIPTADKPGNNTVEQKLFSDIQHPMENVTSDLYLRIGGVTYNESGNYTCTSVNGVGDKPASTGVEVIFKPEFVIVPRNWTVNKGTTVTFMCAASGVPEPRVTWNFKGGNLPPNSTVLNGDLTIPSVRNNKAYEGTYTCTATSRAGSATTDVVLTIYIPPQITEFLNESVVAERGGTVTLSCSASGDPSPRYYWTKDGSRSIPSAAFKNSNKTLQLKNVNSSNDGVYTCWAINAAGNASTSSNLSVHALPSLLKYFKNTTKIEDENVSLSCTGESIPAPNVSWFKNDEPVISSDHILITTKGNFERVTTLSIQKVKYNDHGVYTCSFKNYRGIVNSTGSLIVQVPPNILLPPVSVKEKLGFRVTFNCTVRGFPSPSLLWTKDNVYLIGSKEVEIRKEENEGMIQVATSVTIIQTKRRDTGMYTCKANNTVASTLKSANLTVLEKPDRLEAQNVQPSSRSVVLTWKLLFDGNSPVKFFTVIHNISNGTVSYNVSSTERHFKVLYLTPATFYNFSITATNALGTSDPLVATDTTLEAEPGAPRFLKAFVSSSRSIYINWTVPAITNGKLVKYIVYYDRTEAYFDNSTRPMNQSLPSNITWLLIESLVPFTEYTIQVQAFTDAGGGNKSDSVGPRLTFEDVPGAPHGVSYQEIGDTYMINWSTPLEPNGIIQGYKVFLLIKRDNPDDTEKAKDKVFEVEDGSLSKSVGLHKLNGDKTYNIIVQARTSKGFGKNSTDSVQFTTPITSPPTPPLPSPPNDTTTTTAVIELTEFSDINGPIKYYEVIVLRVPEDYQGSIPAPGDITPNDTKTYDEAHKSSKPAAYIAFWFTADKFHLYKRFKLGNGQKSSQRKRREIKTSYYNGPLMPNTQYQAFTRAFTSKNDYSQSEYIKIKTKEPNKKSQSSTPTPSSPGGIIAGVVVSIMIAVIVAAVFIYFRRKRRGDGRTPDENELQPLETVGAIKEGSINGGLALDVDENRGPIPIQDLKEYYIRMHGNNNCVFSQEYKSISITGTPTTEVCDHPENKARNRYANIKAYDHSRVKLDMEGSSDYINGNYIDGYVRPKQYIATIGPKPETSEHFWWLVWQENVSVIVMLTRPVENGKVKCHQYWPDEGNQEHGALTVTVKETRVFSEFEIRTLSLQMPSRPDLKPRKVTHFFFTAWPDHDVPDEATGLLQFWRAVKKVPTPNSPMVVHCSAGVGRTGTFICIDAMMEQISASEELDVYNYVTKMREQRNYMVQRESQYIFIFYALLEATTFGDTEIASHDLRAKLQKMDVKDPKTYKSRFQTEFELLDGVVHQENTDFTSALKTANAKKNRYTNVLPFEKSRVVLKKISEDEQEDTSYINANYLEGYQQRKAYIATQAPLRDTVGDFWRMVWEEEVHSIVKLVPPKEDSEEAFIDYWSEVEATLFGSLSIETINFDNKETYSVRNINLSETKTENVRKVTLYTCTNWPKDGVPHDSMAVINFIAELQKTQQQTGNHPIVVHCSDGIGRTGTLCALITSLERLKLEDTIDVFTAVRMLRTQRPGMVQTLKQYRFIYDAIMAYVDSFETSLYQNFL